MASNKMMIKELEALRVRLKSESKNEQGRRQIICSDEALQQIIELKPKKLSDFKGVPGVGPTFIEKYGEEFLKVISYYDESSADLNITMEPQVEETLRELEKKLVSLNRRNRLLYLPKLTNKYAFDLFESTGSRAISLIFGNDKFIDIDTVKHKRIIHLLRETNKDMRDKGQNDLYIGYPFVIGRLAGENFDVRAPLVLFPVSEERTSTNVRISLDESRDVLYNNTLILANQKFSGLSRPLPTDSLDQFLEQSFLESVLSFYEENDLKIQNRGETIGGFKEYKAEEFPSYLCGELFVEPVIILGKFSVCSNSIQIDFEKLLEEKKMNALLTDLLNPSQNTDFYSDKYVGESEVLIKDRPLVISEKKINYINDLDSSQENVLAAIDKLDKLVVQGPPGTGKSQTISSLIADFVSRDQNVLMVSEKRTALDVVYSRLGHLSQFALLIDDVGDKEGFYNQLSSLISASKPTQPDEYEMELLAAEIDSLIARLEAITQAMYTVGDFGVAPYKLYQRNQRIDLSDQGKVEQLTKFEECICPDLLGIKYQPLSKLHEDFQNQHFSTQLDRYRNIEKTFPWLEKTKSNLSDYEARRFLEDLKKLKMDIQEWQNRNFISKFLTKNSLIGKSFIDCFNMEPKLVRDLIIQEIDDIIEGFSNYVSYQELKTLYDKLTPDERVYLDSLIKAKEYSDGSLIKANDVLYNHLLYKHISYFEQNHRNIFQEISDFESIFRKISQLINQKKEYTRRLLSNRLAKGAYSLNTTKRRGEIQRVLDSRRKWSVNKFIHKFDFELFNSVKIWLMTPEAVSEIIPMQSGIFDLVIFDEASQMYVEKGIPAIHRAKKVVIAGDHKQLRPSSLGSGRISTDEDDLEEAEELPAALEEESLLDLARFKYDDIMLNFHYRSKYEELIAFSNYAFYKGRLYVSPNFSVADKPPIEVHQMEEAMWINRTNRAEGLYVVKLLKQFFEERAGEETVGIITFNSSQRDLIEDLIDEACAVNPSFSAAVLVEQSRKKNGEDIGLFVKNIESVQGDERDVIIFSVGYAKNENGRLVRNFGWLNQKGGENRLNVAISRAREKIHIVTSFHPKELQVEDAKNDGPRLLKKYLEYAYAVSSGDSNGAKMILQSLGDQAAAETQSFDSHFENLVYDALTSQGLEVATQVGIGGYRIDLAIKQGGEYVLGIECDGRLYHSSKTARERDYHRQKYLESRGWRIHRIWSSNWWKDPNREVQKIMNVVKGMT
ncbi:AAA domain-containing protein [Proteiniclasticum sp. QWL-01]|uniref:AAA domain-containing protein n=1 Tax=Proteiniclasticum sp. QWL-01 TaxID=3036945 RepID=UPI002411199C|nr:AAA domain-containing protein [Proteiniclasticum sp. QWL-01]WFF74287.1 AAA domain-containing protein [Proteiniclasticum sp. QWL-01]